MVVVGAGAAGFTSVAPASSHVTAASCAMTELIGQTASEAITTRIFKIRRGIGDAPSWVRARLPNIGEASASAQDAWLSAQRPRIMTYVVYRVEPNGRDLGVSAKIGVTETACQQREQRLVLLGATLVRRVVQNEVL